jgi:hypothetical protein
MGHPFVPYAAEASQPGGEAGLSTLLAATHALSHGRKLMRQCTQL